MSASTIRTHSFLYPFTLHLQHVGRDGLSGSSWEQGAKFLRSALAIVLNTPISFVA